MAATDEKQNIKWTKELINLNNSLNFPRDYTTLIKEMVWATCHKNDLTVKPINKNEIYVPLEFWFCKDSRSPFDSS